MRYLLILVQDLNKSTEIKSEKEENKIDISLNTNKPDEEKPNQNNENETLSNLETSNKLLFDQIAASKQCNLNQTGCGIVNSTAVSGVNNNDLNHNKHKLFKKASTINSDSLSNLSLAFKKYKPSNIENKGTLKHFTAIYFF